MALKAKYTAPIQVVTTPEMRDELKTIADEDQKSVAGVIRDALELGIPLLQERRADR